MKDVAQHFLDTLLRGGEIDGGWKFAKALQQTRLDYSDGSLGRLDHLLTSIRERATPSREVLPLRTIMAWHPCRWAGSRRRCSVTASRSGLVTTSPAS